MPAPLAPRPRRRTIAVAAALSALTLLAACSDSKKPNATASSGRNGASGSSFSSAPPSTLSSSTPPFTVTPPTGGLTTTTNAQGAVAVACEVIDLGALNAATGRTWTAAKQRTGQQCDFLADNGNLVRVNVQPHPGQSSEAFTTSQQNCDSGSVENVAVADGAYVCRTQGAPVGAILISSIDAVALIDPGSFHGAPPSDVENVVRAMVHSYVAPH